MNLKTVQRTGHVSVTFYPLKKREQHSHTREQIQDLSNRYYLEMLQQSRENLEKFRRGGGIFMFPDEARPKSQRASEPQ